mmetsp:Transcript_600/g.999  ORF Transcript_600/g.999 Transcript_600/m.999 type:complete len:219 (+) Transcript_600:337-993(+)
MAPGKDHGVGGDVGSTREQEHFLETHRRLWGAIRNTKASWRSRVLHCWLLEQMEGLCLLHACRRDGFPRAHPSGGEHGQGRVPSVPESELGPKIPPRQEGLRHRRADPGHRGELVRGDPERLQVAPRGLVPPQPAAQGHVELPGRARAGGWSGQTVLRLTRKMSVAQPYFDRVQHRHKREGHSSSVSLCDLPEEPTALALPKVAHKLMQTGCPHAPLP